MADFFFRLELEDWTPADPPVLHAAVPNWAPQSHLKMGQRKVLASRNRIRLRAWMVALI